MTRIAVVGWGSMARQHAAVTAEIAKLESLQDELLDQLVALSHRS